MHQPPKMRKPSWLKVKLNTNKNYQDMKNLMQKHSLHTVCEEARCPNIYECWDNRTATVMILGDTCTRSCRFCSVKTGRPLELDLEEPKRVADFVSKLKLRHVVVTSVDRDDLVKDFGANIWYETIKGKTDELDPDGGIIYTGNADILKEICPGDFGKIKNQGFCMIGVKNR